MSAPAVVWIAVGLTTTLAVAAVLIALVRQVLLLGRTLRRFQDEVGPVAEEIAAASAAAAARSRGLGTDLPSGRR